jgi:hypothetical protein
MKINILGASLLFTCIACSTPAEKMKSVESQVEAQLELTDPEQLVADIESVHQKNTFKSFEVVEFDLNLVFGGKKRFEGRIYMMTDGSRVKMEDSSSTKLWDGNKAMVLPDTLDNESARFTLLTWSYFFAAPYKLSDPGTKHEFLGQLPLAESEFSANRMTFGNGVGDTPDDWYVVYKDNNSDLLAAMAYIVTGGGNSVEEAEKDPHAITYEAYTEIGGIPFATQWNFWTWTKEGKMNKLLGSASVSNIRLVKKAGDLFRSTDSI